MFEFYITKSASNFGLTSTRPIYERAIAALPDQEAKEMCLKFADMERRLGEIDRARAIYGHASQFCDPRTNAGFWQKWEAFEVQHGNEDTFKEMLRIKRSVQAQYKYVNPDQHMKSKNMLISIETAPMSTSLLPKQSPAASNAPRKAPGRGKARKQARMPLRSAQTPWQRWNGKLAPPSASLPPALDPRAAIVPLRRVSSSSRNPLRPSTQTLLILMMIWMPNSRFSFHIYFVSLYPRRRQSTSQFFKRLPAPFSLEIHSALQVAYIPTYMNVNRSFSHYVFLVCDIRLL